MGNLKITAAKLALDHGRLTPFIQIGDQWYVMETKQTLLEAGIATILPVEEGAERYQATLAADPAIGRNSTHELEDATDDPGVVALARKAAELLLDAHAKAGPIHLK